MLEDTSRPTSSPVNILGGEKGGQGHGDKVSKPGVQQNRLQLLLLLLCNDAMSCRHITLLRVKHPNKPVGLPVVRHGSCC